MILVIGGTKDSINIATKLQELDYNVLVSAKTPYGEKIISQNNLQPFEGRLGISSGELANTLSANDISIVIDATHPFSNDLTKEIIHGCTKANVPLIRFDRPNTELPKSDKLIRTDSFSEAAAITAQISTGNVFLAIGTNNLKYFTDKLNSNQIIARVLPVPNSLKQCLELGLNPENIIAIQGPISYSLNRSLLKNYNASVLVTKDSGKQGGLLEKVNAAIDLNIDIIVIDKPDYPNSMTATDYQELVQLVKELI